MVENQLQSLYDFRWGDKVLSYESKGIIFQLESRRKKLMEDKEAMWRLKSRALWIECGDENTKIFRPLPREDKISILFGAFRIRMASQSIPLKVWPI